MDCMTLAVDFISADEERKLIEFCRTNITARHAGRNSVKRYGSSAPYPAGYVSNSIPAEFQFILERLPHAANHVTVNEYRQGQAIAPHIDSASSGPIIQIVSLGSPAAMRFTRKGEPPINLDLPPRSLCILAGPLRHEWQHAILPVEAYRISLVFRLGTRLGTNPLPRSYLGN